MTKTDRIQIERCKRFGDASTMAATVAAIFRAGSAKTQAECREIIRDCDLEHALIWINGCPVPRV